MKITCLPEFAALLAAYADEILSSPERLSDACLGRYHKVSRDQLHRWMSRLERIQRRMENDAAASSARVLPADDIAELTEIVLLSEVVTRIWTAMLTAGDRRHQRNCAESVARNILVGHMLLRHKTMGTLLQCDHVPSERITAINDLRRRCERWTDILLAHIIAPHDMWEYAFDEQRARDYADEHLREDAECAGGTVWKLVLVGLRVAFRNAVRHDANLPALQRSVISSIFNMLPPGLFCELRAVSLPSD